MAICFVIVVFVCFTLVMFVTRCFLLGRDFMTSWRVSSFVFLPKTGNVPTVLRSSVGISSNGGDVFVVFWDTLSGSHPVAVTSWEHSLVFCPGLCPRQHGQWSRILPTRHSKFHEIQPAVVRDALTLWHAIVARLLEKESHFCIFARDCSSALRHFPGRKNDARIVPNGKVSRRS